MDTYEIIEKLMLYLSELEESVEKFGETIDELQQHVSHSEYFVDEELDMETFLDDFYKKLP